MNRDEQRINELNRIESQLVQIKVLLAAILLVLLAPVIGPGPLFQMIVTGMSGLAAIYAGLRTFEYLVKRKVGKDWGEAQLATFLDENDTRDADDSVEPE